MSEVCPVLRMDKHRRKCKDNKQENQVKEQLFSIYYTQKLFLVDNCAGLKAVSKGTGTFIHTNPFERT